MTDREDPVEVSATISSEDDFYSALSAILGAADANGIDVCGWWAVARGEEGQSGWDVEIVDFSHRTTIVNPSKGTLVEAIVTAVAAEDDVDPLALPPLQDAFDVDALEQFVQSVDDDARVTWEVSYNGYCITIHPDESFELTKIR